MEKNFLRRWQRTSCTWSWDHIAWGTREFWTVVPPRYIVDNIVETMKEIIKTFQRSTWKEAKRSERGCSKQSEAPKKQKQKQKLLPRREGVVLRVVVIAGRERVG